MIQPSFVGTENTEVLLRLTIEVLCIRIATQTRMNTSVYRGELIEGRQDVKLVWHMDRLEAVEEASALSSHHCVAKMLQSVLDAVASVVIGTVHEAQVDLRLVLADVRENRLDTVRRPILPSQVMIEPDLGPSLRFEKLYSFF